MKTVREIARETCLEASLRLEAEQHLIEAELLRDARITEAGAFAHVKVAGAMLELADWLREGDIG